MKKTFALIFLIAGSLHAQTNIGLDDLISKARDFNPQQEQMGLIDEITALQIKNLKGAYLPQSSLNGQATWQSEVTSLPIRIPGVDIELPAQDQYKVTLDIQQNLYDGGLTASQKSMALANQKVEKAKVEVDLYKSEEQVTALYFGVLFANRQKGNAELILTEINANLERVKAAIENGVAIKSNLLALEAKKIELEQSLIEIDKKKEAALEGIYLLTGAQLSKETVFESPATFQINSYENDRPELSLLSAQQQSIMASESLVKSKNKPKVALFGTGGYGRPGLNFLARDFSPYFMGGLQLKVPLSHLYNGVQQSEIQQLKVNRLRIEKQKESFDIASNVQLASLKKEIERLESLIESDNKLIAIREEITEVSSAQLENGIITATDYLEELNKQDLAKRNLILHEVQLMQANRNIKIILGQ
ncbi:TolC family protein [Arcticibacterium luteifluviistationis]|uniref:Transporter n=1 Tax=Arcticibacterium luteifluviistationis TaxID=1784714 RepID=A0A2Z4GDU8_9BACT|nr:TolC family protein [Arcticibacterium luteifluviistationis]AWV99344.1 hypothetical protein DJ013_14710 [Arcticibacterium luteifluviistationis]